MEEKSDEQKGFLGRRRRVESELKQCQAKLKVLLDSVSSGVAVYEAKNEGADFIFKDFNAAAERIDKIKKKDLLGKSVTEVFPGVKDFGLFEVFQRVWKTGTPEHHPVSTYKDERITGWRENYVFKLPSGEIVAVYDDVTEYKHSELAVRMSEQCFRAIADYTYDWEVWVSPGGRVLWTNPGAHRVTGYTVKEIAAMPDYPTPIVYQPDKKRMSRAFRSALKGSTGNDVQFRLERKDGRLVWAEISWQPIFDEQGNSLGHRESIRDVTARRQAQEALRKAEREKEIILDSLAELVLYQDREITVLWANRPACESVGLTREELIGRHCYEIWAGAEKPCGDCPVVKAMETGRTQEAEKWTPDGRAWFIQASPVRSEKGSITGAVEIALDITDRKQAQKRLQQREQHPPPLAEESGHNSGR